MYTHTPESELIFPYFCVLSQKSKTHTPESELIFPYFCVLSHFSVFLFPESKIKKPKMTQKTFIAYFNMLRRILCHFQSVLVISVKFRGFFIYWVGGGFSNSSVVDWRELFILIEFFLRCFFRGKWVSEYLFK